MYKLVPLKDIQIEPSQIIDIVHTDELSQIIDKKFIHV